jgi:arylsulfatase A-like enzyme
MGMSEELVETRDGRRDRRRPRRAGLSGTLLLAIALGISVLGGGLAALDTGTLPTLERAAAAEERPNIVVIESDDQAEESMRVMRNVNNMIGAQGATFTNSFVNFALCCPSRATFLTGQYAHNHGVLGNLPPDGGFQRFQTLHGNNNLAVWLKKAGYFTGMIGKYLNGYVNDPVRPPGWSDWRATAPATQRVYNYTLNDNGQMVHYGTARADFKQDVLSGQAVEFVNERAPKPRPFFLWLTYTAPHAGPPNSNPNPPSDCQQTAKPAPRHAHRFDSEPLPRPPNFNEGDVSDKPGAIRGLPLLAPSTIADVQRKYRCRLEAMLSVDDGVRSVVDALRAQGELDNTLVVYTSDNGFFHGEHRIRSEKGRIYEESIRVPLQMRGPGIPRGIDVDPLVINADLAPTIVDVAGAEAGLTMDGSSLIPVVQDPGVARGRELLVEQPGFEAIRTERYMYAEYKSGERELYDLQADPYELQSRDASPEYATIKAKLAASLKRLANCSGATCRTQAGPFASR